MLNHLGPSYICLYFFNGLEIMILTESVIKFQMFPKPAIWLDYNEI